VAAAFIHSPYPVELKRKVNQNSKERLQVQQQKKERDKIVDFFLKLFSVQLKGTNQTSKSFKLIDPNPDTNSFRYELKIKLSGKWITRPMGIMAIGEEAGRKSRCFKVIYDDILVIKIPLKPIRDFERYIDVIRNERMVARKLQPDIECIVPGVSSVLKKIPSFSQGMYRIPEEMEEMCIERLKQFPKFQDYLKIDGGFVFIMEISRYSFLVQLLDNMFNINPKIKQEIIKHPDFISNLHYFEGRYGVKNIPVWLQMNHFFQDYQAEIDSLLTKHGLNENVGDYEKKEWFLAHLAGKKIMPSDSHISADFLKELNFSIFKLKSEYAGAFQDYLKTVKAYVKRENFLQSKTLISSIIAGILRLLALLKEKQVAVRDLKPDNIFIAENSSENSYLPEQGKHFPLGLIDLETAIANDVTKIKKLEQPLPGGTPSYATPSNFVSNETLKEFYEDVPGILHLQDWHASLCMVYLAVTGESLFETSKNLIYEFVKNFQKTGAGEEKLIAIFKENNFLFWNSAQNEFSKRITHQEKRLKQIEVVVPYEACEMFLEELEKLKIQAADKNQWIRAFKSQTMRISAYNILIFMFRVIIQSMHQKQSR
jgi:serine/threonine protein kinase